MPLPPTSSQGQPDPTTEWARAVVAGDVMAGDLCRRACERHLRDLVDAPARGLHWRPDLAGHALGFFPAVLTVTAGQNAGQRFQLPSYTTFVVGSLFGWMRADGTRRFRRAWIETGKGQIKSPLMAAIGLYVMGWLGIPRAEVYAIAKDRLQSNVLFADAVAMCRADVPGETESLEARGDTLLRGTGDNVWKIEHPSTGSKFQPLAGDAQTSGPRPALILGDEIHEWRSNAMIETWGAALAKMPGSPLMMLGTNTPAADQVVGTDYSEQNQRILRGEVDSSDADAAFAIICRTDVTDDPLNDESVWPKALPCLGITYSIENVREQVKASRLSIATRMTTQRLYFGIPLGTSSYWIEIGAWEAAQGRVEPDAMHGNKCWLSLDLSQKNDLTALGMGWADDAGVLHATVRYWKPRASLADAAVSDNVPYLQWAEAGLIEATPGKSIDYEFVARQIQDVLADGHDVQSLAIDPAYFTQFAQACDRLGLEHWVWKGPEEPEGSGLKVVIHGQGKAGMHSERSLWMPRSIRALEDRILEGRIVIDESPVTKWCSGNVALTPDAQGNRFLDKKQSRGRIDGLTALAMLAGASEGGTTTAGSIYDDEAAYTEAFGRTVDTSETPDTAGDRWDPAVLKDMRHPLFAEHKARFERWQDAQPDD